MPEKPVNIFRLIYNITLLIIFLINWIKNLLLICSLTRYRDSKRYIKKCFDSILNALVTVALPVCLPLPATVTLSQNPLSAVTTLSDHYQPGAKSRSGCSEKKLGPARLWLKCFDTTSLDQLCSGFWLPPPYAAVQSIRPLQFFIMKTESLSLGLQINLLKC